MKKIVEDLGEGLESLLGEEVLLVCAGYFYAGKLIGVNKTCVKLKGAKIVYDTGHWNEPKYSDAQDLCCDEWYVQCALIESFGRGKSA